MALSPMYAAILQDLNKAVATHQPEDVLQFCANFFNAKLEEQRIAGRISLAEQQQQQLYQHSPYQHQQHSLRSSASSSSLPAKSSFASSNTVLPSIVKKKVSLPSLVDQGYTFGGAGGAPSNNRDLDYTSPTAGPSPYSEVPPSLRSSHGHARNGSFGSPGAPSTLPSTAGAAPPQQANILWSRPFGGPSDGMMPGESEEAAGLRISGARRSSESRDRLGNLPSSSSYGSNGATIPLSPSTANGGRGGLGPDSGIPSGYNLGRRTSVSAESIDPSTASNQLPKTVIPKTPSQRARIESSIEKNLLFRNLDEEQHNDVLNAMKEVRVKKGVEVIVQGAVGDFFYVVESGEFKVWVRPQPSSGMITSPPASSMAAMRARSLSPGVNGEEGSRADQEGGTNASASGSATSSSATTTTVNEDGSVTRGDGSKLVATISAGGSFGELALMYNAPRAATVVCSSESATLWALDRITFRTILMEHTSKKRRMYEKFLAEVPILVSLEAHERSKIADALEERIYEEGEDVVREGELGKNFYIIESGRAEVLKHKGGDHQERVGTLSKGDYFGELALLNSAPRAATVRPLPGSGRLRVATLGEKAFTRLLGPVVEILTRRAERNYGGVSMSNTGSTSSNGTSPSSDSRRGSLAAGAALITPTNPKSTRDEDVTENGGRDTPTTVTAQQDGEGRRPSSSSRRASAGGRHSSREQSVNSTAADDVVMQQD